MPAGGATFRRPPRQGATAPASRAASRNADSGAEPSALLLMIANAGRPVRGVIINDVVEALGHAWRLSTAPPPAPILSELPAVITHRIEAIE